MAPGISPLLSRNRIEEAFLDRLIACLRAEGLRAVQVFDRGFERPAWKGLLQERAGSALDWVELGARAEGPWWMAAELGWAGGRRM